MTDPRDPLLKRTIEGIAATLRTLGKARMAFPLGIPAYPLTAVQLREMGVAYANCYPGDLGRLLQSYREQLKQVQAELG